MMLSSSKGDAIWSRWIVLPLAVGALYAANSARAETAPPGQAATVTLGQEELTARGVVVDEANPEASVPSPEWAQKHPMEMGYLMMVLADKALAAEKAGKHLAAARLYEALGKAVPDRAVSFGKACRAYHAAGDFARAVTSCREALGKGGVTVQDHLRFVRVTLDQPGTLDPAQIEDVEAVLSHVETDTPDLRAREAVGYLRCDLALRVESASKLDKCIQDLRLLGTSKVRLLPYEWSLSMLKGDSQQAGAMIERAEALGLPVSAVAAMQARLDATRPHLPVPTAVIGAWGALALVLLSAALLSMQQWLRSRPRAATARGPRAVL